MTNDASFIGKNIKEARLSKNWSQMDLSQATGISNSVISAYENGKKMPGLDTLVRFSEALKTTIDQLYYGNANEAFIRKASNSGQIIVNSIEALHQQGVIEGIEGSEGELWLKLDPDRKELIRLVNSLNEFIVNIDTYSEPDVYLQQIKDSVANEINTNNECARKLQAQKKALLETSWG